MQTSVAALLILSSLTLSLLLSSAAKLPSDFKRCSRKDSTCLLEAMQSVLKKLSKPVESVALPSLEPLEVSVLSIGAGNGGVAVEQNYKNVKVYGFTGVELKKVEFDFDNKILRIVDKVPKLKVVADYDLNGKILLLPVRGTGVSTVTMEEVDCTLDFPFKEYEKNGESHLKMDGVKLTMDPKLVRYNFENLFNGDKALGENINRVLNDNWKDVFEDVKKGYEEAYGLILQNICNRLFAKVPLSEIFLDQ